jgi:hypothetical protein
MSDYHLFVDIMKDEIIKSNQKDWFLSFKSKYQGGYIANIDNPKLQALKNQLNYSMSDTVFAIYCYVVEHKLLNDNSYSITIDDIV